MHSIVFITSIFSIFILLFLLYYNQQKSSISKSKILISVETEGGLANKLFGLSSCMILSKLGSYILSGIVMNIAYFNSLFCRIL